MGTAGIVRTGTRSRSTTVPASMSPIRRPRGEASELNSATAPVNRLNTPKSMMNPASPRARACLNRIGPPSSRTTRSPSTIFPTDRPRVRVSTVTG